MRNMSYTFRMFCALSLALMSWGANAQVNITMNWTTGAFAGEPGWEVIRVATNTTVFCEQSGGAVPVAGATVLNLAPGTYEVRGYDSFGDSWNGGLLTFSQGAFQIFSTSGPGNFGFSPGDNACPGPSPVNGQSSAILGTFNVVAPSCAITCPASITVNNTPGLCGANVTIPQPATSGCAQAPAGFQTFSSPVTALNFVASNLVATSATVPGGFPTAVGNGTLRVIYTGDFDLANENTPILDENGVQVGIIGPGFNAMRGGYDQHRSDRCPDQRLGSERLDVVQRGSQRQRSQHLRSKPGSVPSYHANCFGICYQQLQWYGKCQRSLPSGYYYCCLDGC